MSEVGENKRIVLSILSGVIEAIDVTMAEAQMHPGFEEANEVYRVAFLDGMNCVREMVDEACSAIEVMD